MLLSAHGVAPAVREAAEGRGLTVIDATCPFVTKVHSEVKRYARDGYTIVMIGKKGHDEVVGVAGEVPDQVTVVETVADAREVCVASPSRLAVVTQTTLSLTETENILAVLRERFPALAMPPRIDICYATTNRQAAVRRVAEQAERVLVLGARNSSNTKRLVEVARRAGTVADLVCDLADLADLDFAPTTTVGVTAGASTPESFVAAVLAFLGGKGFEIVETVSVAEEAIRFALPPEVR